MEISVLEWDTDFFKKPVAKIEINQNEEVDIIPIIDFCKEQDFKLLYFFVNSSNVIVTNKLLELLGSPINKKLIFISTAVNTQNCNTISGDGITIAEAKKEYGADFQIQLLKLAIKAGSFSRFKLDKKIGEQEFTEMYRLWIFGLVNDYENNRIIIASTVRKNKNAVIGFLAYKFMEESWKIEFISVDEKWQHKGIGGALVKKMMEMASEKSINYITVETQEENIKASNFYSSCGFSVKESVSIYHVHL